MLAKTYVLKDQKNFDRVEKEGKIFQSDSFGLAFFDRKADDCSRFGFIVSTKIAKEAVARNRIKRALSEAVRYCMNRIKGGYDVVFLAKQQSMKKPTDELMRETERALEMANLTKQ